MVESGVQFDTTGKMPDTALIELSKLLKGSSKAIEKSIDKIDYTKVTDRHFIATVSIFLAQINNFVKAKEGEQLMKKMEDSLGSPIDCQKLCEELSKTKQPR